MFFLLAIKLDIGVSFSDKLTSVDSESNPSISIKSSPKKAFANS